MMEEGKCPNCGSSNLDYDSAIYDHEAGCCMMATCEECGAEIKEIFKTVYIKSECTGGLRPEAVEAKKTPIGLVPADEFKMKACCRTCTGLQEEYGDTYCIEDDKVILDTESHRCKGWWPSNEALENAIFDQFINKDAKNETNEKA